jgi:uncharacterized phage-associated protein
MPTVHDVDSYLQSRLGVSGGVKRHKMLYAINRLSLFKTGNPLFSAEAEAWKWGPAFPGVYYNPQRRGNPDAIPAWGVPIISEVHQALGNCGGKVLAKRSHNRYPEWRAARQGLGPNENGNNVITFEAMRRALAREIATIVDGQVRVRVPSTKYGDIQQTLTNLRRITQGRLDFLTA